MTETVPFRSSPKWAFMKFRNIGPNDEDVYLARIYLVKTPWFSVMLHRIFRPDRQRDLHDHPWNFRSFVLWGHYMEEYRDAAGGAPDSAVLQRRIVRWYNRKTTQDRHRIAWCSRSPVWTLVITGRDKRTWGFWVEDGTRFVKWKDYEKLYYA